MTTRSVDFYERIIANEFKRMPLQRDSKFNQNPFFSKGDQTKALLNGISTAIEQYLEDEHGPQSDRELPVLRVARRTHSHLLEDILRVIQARGKSTPAAGIVKAVLKSLEQGVLEQRCNPKGNYANLCRAIVKETSEMPDWKFSDRFKDTLGMKSSPVTSIHRLSLD